MLTQLATPIPLKTPKGKAWAVAIIDYGPQWDLQWVTFVHDTGECWTFRNSEIRQERNYTFGLPSPSPVQEHADQLPMRSQILKGPAALNNGHAHLNSASNV